MHLNPIEIERLFTKTRRSQRQAGSERVQLFCLYEFLKAIPGDFSEYDSYLIQLFEEFPVLRHPLLFTGLTPKILNEIIEICEQAVQQISELNDNDRVQQNIDHLRTGLSHLHSWLNIPDPVTDVGSALMITDATGELEQRHGDVFIPVIEQDTCSNKQTGRLRKLRVDMIGESSSGKHELKPVFGVIGANTGNLGYKPARAAGQLLTDSLQNHKTWSGTATFELSHTWHEGSSANLALAALFYCGMLKAEQKREYFRLNPGIAMTGDIDEYGNVLPVDEETLPQKIEAAFFSWVQALVVPVEQLSDTLDYVEKLNTGFPGRNLVIIGIGSLRELFYDRRLTLYKQTSLVEHAAKQIWKRKFSTVSIILFLAMAITLAAFIIGPLDRNPVMASFEGEMMYVMNKNGRTLYSENVGETAAERAILSSDRVIQFVDINTDGINEVLKFEVASNTDAQWELHLLSSGFNDTLWTNDLFFDIPYESHPYLEPNKYGLGQMVIIDIDNDGEKELIASLAHTPYFPSLIGVFNLRTGKLERFYTNPGNISYLEISDIDDDGKPEIIFGLELKAYRMRAIAILPHDFKTGHGRLGLRYRTSLDETVEKAIIAFPMSVVGRTVRKEAGELWQTGHIDLIRNNRDAQTLQVPYFEVKRSKKNPELVDMSLVFTFDYRLNLLSIGSSDNYDIIGEQLYTQGKIPFLPDARYLESRKDSLLYWDGTQFINHPTLNKKYLELVGEDSTYYKNWYFSN